MSLEAVLMRIQTLKVDTARTLSEHFKVKLQLEEQIEDNEVKLHFCRGVLGGLDEIEKVINEMTGEQPIIPSLKVAMDKKLVKFPDVENIEAVISKLVSATDESGNPVTIEEQK